MSQQQGGWGAPPGGGGWGGAPPGGGGGGYGPPPGGGGYGPPPGGGGYGPPPGGGGYGAPPGGGYGGPPGGGFVPPPGGIAPMTAGGRVNFIGEGGDLFKIYLLYNILPIVGVYVVGGGAFGLASVIDQQVKAGGVLVGIGGLFFSVVLLVGLIGTIIVFGHKFNEFYYQNHKIDGQQCEYRGTMGEFAKTMGVNLLLTMVTAGIYAPWAYVNYKKYCYANTAVNGQMGRLTFDGSPGDLLGKYIVGMILTYCTLGIYSFWLMNDIFAFKWENSKIDGRPFQFRRDPGGLFGTLILNYIITYCTMGIYAPWMMCNLFKWESEHVS